MQPATLDITGLTCPMTWVRTKLALERLAPGETLEVRCRPGEALENVPRSATAAGHAVAVEGTTIRIVTRRKPVTSPDEAAGRATGEAE